MRFVLAVVLVLLSACGGDSTAPRQMTLTFEPSHVIVVGDRLSEGRIACGLDVVIQAHGGAPGTSLVLLQIVNTFFDVNGNRANTTSATPSDWFGSNRLDFDERAVAHRVANGDGQFSAQIALTYADPDGATHVETLTLVCQ